MDARPRGPGRARHAAQAGLTAVRTPRRRSDAADGTRGDRPVVERAPPHPRDGPVLPGLLARLLGHLWHRRRSAARLLHGQCPAVRRRPRNARSTGAIERGDAPAGVGRGAAVRALRAGDRELLHPLEGRTAADDVDRPVAPRDRGRRERGAIGETGGTAHAGRRHVAARPCDEGDEPRPRPGLRRLAGLASTDPVRVRLDGRLARRLPAVAGDVRVLPAPVCVRGRRARRHSRRRLLVCARSRASARETAHGVVRARGERTALGSRGGERGGGRAGPACRGPSERGPGRFPGEPAEPQPRRPQHHPGERGLLRAADAPVGDQATTRRRRGTPRPRGTRRAVIGRRVRGDAGNGRSTTADRAHRPAQPGRERRQRHERAPERAQRPGVPGRAAHPGPRARDPPTPLPSAGEPAHRRHLLPERSRGDLPPDVLVRVAGPPARAAGGRPRREADMTAGERRLAIDIVVPLYNEEQVVAEFHRRLVDVLTPLRREHDVRIYYVNDGSVDHTGDELAKLAADDPGITVLELSRNFGHQAALTAGLDRAEGDAVVTLDGDGQHPPELIVDMVALYQAGYEVVLTQRVSADQPRFKRWTSTIFYRLLSAIADTPINAGSADYRLLARPVLEALREMREYHRFLRGMVAWAGYKTVVLPYAERARLGGDAKYSLSRMARLASDAVFSFSLVPIGIALVVGLGFLVLAAAEALWVTSFWLTGRQHLLVPGWSSLMFMVLIVGGALMIAVGLVGIYVGYIFQEVKRRPVYLVRAVHGSAGDRPPRPRDDSQS